MGRNSQQRRAKKLRQSQQRLRQELLGSSRGAPGATRSIPELVQLACGAAAGPTASRAGFQHVVDLLLRMEHAAGDPADRPSTEVLRQLRTVVDAALEGGLQPADLVHLARRDTNQRVGRLAAALAADHARRHHAVERAPMPWLEQLSALGVYRYEGEAVAAGTLLGRAHDPLGTWAAANKVHPDDVLPAALQLLAVLRSARRQTVLLPPPSQWNAATRATVPAGSATGAPGQEVDAKVLSRIRALLAKAESTSFEAEAAAFTAKAQEMMSRHSIDAAVLAATAEGGSVRSGTTALRVHIDDPYATEKATFLAAIASVNSVKCVWSPQAGFSTLVGFPVDVQLTDLLFTSLLVQATRASADATAKDPSLRNAPFRRAFIVAFANRVADRLEAARGTATTEAEQQYGAALVPILDARTAAVEAAYEEMFPDTVPMRAKRYDAAGWYAGQAAGDRADIGVRRPLPEG